MVLDQREGYPVERGQQYVLPKPFPNNPVPEFPREMVGSASAEEVSILVLLIVDESGRVIEVRPEQAGADSGLSAYFREAISACRSWRFTPLQVKSLKKAGSALAGQRPKEFVSVRNLPFSLRYEFTFSDRGIVTNSGLDDPGQ
jgi:hypothetical protein